MDTNAGVLSGGEESCPSVESLVNWLLEHDDVGPAELSDDSDVLLSYIDDSWSDQESLSVPTVDEVSVLYVLISKNWFALYLSLGLSSDLNLGLVFNLGFVGCTMCIYDLSRWVRPLVL